LTIGAEHTSELVPVQRRANTLLFHANDWPLQVWAVDITPAGLIWTEAEIVEVTRDRVSVVYRGDPAGIGGGAIRARLMPLLSIRIILDTKPSGRTNESRCRRRSPREWWQKRK
jgi:hypothetical protein